MLTRCFILGLLLSVAGCSTPANSSYQAIRTVAQNSSMFTASVPGTPKAVFAATSVANVGNHKMAFDLHTYQWQNRLLLVFAPSEDSPVYQKQMQLFEGQQAGFKERDLVLVKLLTDGKSRVEEQKLDEADVAKVRSRFRIAPQDFRVILVGKDGTAKRRDSNPVEPKVIFNQIDAMPMRQQEMRDRTRG